jgi:hypothetical protein
VGEGIELADCARVGGLTVVVTAVGVHRPAARIFELTKSPGAVTISG